MLIKGDVYNLALFLGRQFGKKETVKMQNWVGVDTSRVLRKEICVYFNQC